jgi:hypothetical protein
MVAPRLPIPAQSAFVMHAATQVCVAVRQTLVAPPQSELVRHATHDPVAGSQTGVAPRHEGVQISPAPPAAPASPPPLLEPLELAALEPLELAPLEPVAWTDESEALGFEELRTLDELPPGLVVTMPAADELLLPALDKPPARLDEVAPVTVSVAELVSITSALLLAPLKFEPIVDVLPPQSTKANGTANPATASRTLQVRLVFMQHPLSKAWQ